MHGPLELTLQLAGSRDRVSGHAGEVVRVSGLQREGEGNVCAPCSSCWGLLTLNEEREPRAADAVTTRGSGSSTSAVMLSALKACGSAYISSCYIMASAKGNLPPPILKKTPFRSPWASRYDAHRAIELSGASDVSGAPVTVEEDIVMVNETW